MVTLKPVRSQQRERDCTCSSSLARQTVPPLIDKIEDLFGLPAEPPRVDPSGAPWQLGPLRKRGSGPHSFGVDFTFGTLLVGFGGAFVMPRRSRHLETAVCERGRPVSLATNLGELLIRHTLFDIGLDGVSCMWALMAAKASYRKMPKTWWSCTPPIRRT